MNFFKTCKKNLPICLLLLLAIIVLIYFLYNFYNIDKIIEAMDQGRFTSLSFPDHCKFERSLQQENIIYFLGIDDNNEEKYLKYENGELIPSASIDTSEKFVLGNANIVNSFFPGDNNIDDSKVYLVRQMDISDNIMLHSYLLENENSETTRQLTSEEVGKIKEFVIKDGEIDKIISLIFHDH